MAAVPVPELAPLHTTRLDESKELVAHSCVHCQKVIVNDDLVSGLRKWKGSTEPSQLLNVGLGATLGDILEGIAQDCKFATQLLEYFTYLPCDALLAELELCAWIQFNVGSGQFPEMIKALGFWNRDTRNVELVSRAWSKHGVSMFAMCASKDDPASKAVETRPINRAPFSGASVNQMRGWLDDCSRTHSECQPPPSRRLPTRLIRVHENQNGRDGELSLQLVTDTSDAGQYAALSYCWGSPAGPRMMTTKSTMAKWSEGIPWQEAPRTIQDAARVTISLGLNFLWVDALCILQDDEKDKEQEIATMSAIYNDAHIVIVASRASCVRDGFLQSRQPNTPMAFHLPFRGKDGTPGTVQVFLPWPTTEPLDTRAWAMQERLLARRTLEFGTSQTRFSCQRHVDGLCDGWTQKAPFSALRVQRLPRPGSDVNGHMEDPLGQWDQLVYSYTRRKLSNQNDRIFALSGLASKFNQLWSGCQLEPSCQYLAGLWSDVLPETLLWCVHDLADRPAQDQAPSWSWTAVEGAIHPHWLGDCSNPPPASDFELLETVVVPKLAHAPFGALASASLKVRGRLKAVEWKQTRDGTRTAYCDRLRVPGGCSEAGFLALRAVSDARERDGLGQDWSLIHLLLVLEFPAPVQREYWFGVPRSEYAGLMLRKVGPDTYSRLGKFCFTPEFDGFYESVHPQSEGKWRSRFEFQRNWFQGCTLETAVLV